MPENTKSRLLVFIIIISLIALVIWGIYWFISKNKNVPPQDRAVSIGVATVQMENAPLHINALGTVNSTYTATVRSRVDGQLMKLHFTEGQFVEEGQLLAELDARPFQAELKQAEGQLMKDKALLDNARLDLQRYYQLLEQNSIAKQQVDTQIALVKQYEGTVKLDQGAVDHARLQLTYSQITAPISGRVGLRQVDLGNIVQASDTNGIVTITQEQPINVVFSIPEINLTELLQAYNVNKKLVVEAWDRENQNKISEGTLLAIDNQLNTDTGTIGIKAIFENTDQKLFPNQFVNIHLNLGTKPNAIVVPSIAIQLGKLGQTVYRVNNNETVSLIKIKTGAKSGENTIIEEGLEPGQIVVIDGVDKLRDGSRIKIVNHLGTEKNASPVETAPSAEREQNASPIQQEKIETQHSTSTTQRG